MQLFAIAKFLFYRAIAEYNVIQETRPGDEIAKRDFSVYLFILQLL